MTKILLVEDDKSLREIYGVRLLAEGYDIVSAGDGEDALAMAIKEKPTLIISDVMMPKISGFDMLDILRSTTETRDIKVIMMTALSSEDQRARGEQLGADRYLVKSQVGIEDVVRTVHEVLGDTPGGVKAAATAAPVTEEPVSSAPAPVAENAAKPEGESVATTSATPGNEAGPLPPQPTEIKVPEPVIEPVAAPIAEAPETSEPEESSLPQPTAPFSSPRPVNLGEQVVHPEAGEESTTPETPTIEIPEVPASNTPTAAEPAELTPLAETPAAEPAPEASVEPAGPAAETPPASDTPSTPAVS